MARRNNRRYHRSVQMSIQPTTSTPIARLSADAGRSLRTTLIALALPVMVAAITAAVHWPALSAQAESFDDPYYLAADGIVANPGWASVRKLFGELLKPTGVPGYAHPLAMLSLMLDYATGGRLDQPFAFHRTNLVLHVATTVLIVVLLQLLFRRPGAAAGGGLLFGLHPVNVEIVAWIAQRKALLAGFFGVWCLVLYVLWVSRRRTWLYVLSLLAFVLATMSKPSALPLPVLLLVLDFWPLHRLTLRALREKVPFFALHSYLLKRAP